MLLLYRDFVVVSADELKEKYPKEVAEIMPKFEDYKKEVTGQIIIYKQDP